MLEEQRRRTLGALNSRYIYGRVVREPFCLLSVADLLDQHKNLIIEADHLSLAASPYHSFSDRDCPHDETNRQIQLILCRKTYSYNYDHQCRKFAGDLCTPGRKTNY